MANTDKQNFRCDTETRWQPAMAKLEMMRAKGYIFREADPRGSVRVDMTRVLGDVVDKIRDASTAEIAEMLGLEKIA